MGGTAGICSETDVHLGRAEDADHSLATQLYTGAALHVTEQQSSQETDICLPAGLASGVKGHRAGYERQLQEGSGLVAGRLRGCDCMYNLNPSGARQARILTHI